MHVDITFTRTIWKQQLLKLKSLWLSKGLTFTTETLWLYIEKDGKLLDICQEKSYCCCIIIFLKRGGNVHCTVTVMAVIFVGKLMVRHA